MRVLSYLTAIAVTMILVSGASAALVNEWDYNAGPPFSTDASTGSGESSGFAIPIFGFPLNDGSSDDPASVSPWDGTSQNGAATRSAPSSNNGDPNGPASGLAIAQWNTSTPQSDIVFTWDMVSGYRSSRFYQISVTTDGVNYNPVSGGVGTGSTVAGVGSATVDSDGLITVLFDDGFVPGNGKPVGAPAVDYLTDLSYAFPTGSAVESNPDFGIQIAAIHDPNGSDYVSSFAGTTEMGDPNSGFIRSSGSGGGSTRYDMVSISGIPEPATLALAACGAAFACTRRRRR